MYLLGFVLLTSFILYFFKFPFRERLFEINKLYEQKGINVYQINVSNCLITVDNQTWTILLREGRLYVYPGENKNERCTNGEFGYLLDHKTGSLTNKCLTPLKKIRSIFVRDKYLNIAQFPRLSNTNLLDVVNFLLIEKNCLLLK